MGHSVLHYFFYLLGLHKPNTQTTEAEQCLLAYWIKDALVAIEIGVFEGFNTALLARKMAPEGRLYGIDPFFAGKMGISWQQRIAKKYLKREDIAHKVNLIKALSKDAIEQIPVAPDFIFVDGDHSIEGISNDWQLYSNILKPGGLIALHDTAAPAHQSWKSAMESVEYFDRHIRYDPRFEQVAMVDSLRILRKIG